MKLFITIMLMANSAFATVVLNDADLSSLELKEPKGLVSQTITPDEIESEDSRNTSSIKVTYAIRKNGEVWDAPSDNLPLMTCGAAQSESRWVHNLQNEKFSIQNNGRVYRVEQILECGKDYTLIFDHDTDAGQAIRIFEIFAKAEKMLGDIGRLDFWKRRIRVQWPGRGDYYQFNTVNITEGHHWDVVGHELGHAIYDQADIGAFGGGAHRIDECYSEALALSEGWASYFSAWLSIKLDDADAKFEYLVPRRAPIHIENVPADVCAEPTNEWRVSSFLWDLIDLNDDNEAADRTFLELWDMTLNKSFRSINALARHIRDNGWDPVLVGAVFKNNFLQDLR